MKSSRTPQPNAYRVAAHIALAYLTIGLIWVTLSDRLVHHLYPIHLFPLLQTYKAWLFVTVTAGVVYGLVYFYVARLLKAERALRKAEEEARQRELELAHASRLVVLGELASALAHELTQPLGAMLHYAEGCQAMLREHEAQRDGDRSVAESASDDPARDRLTQGVDQIVGQAQRADQIVRRLRTFARKQTPRPTAVNLNDLVMESLPLLTPLAERLGVAFELELDPQVPRAQADALQIQQVLVNLGSNAVQAAARQPEDRPRWVKWRTRLEGDRICVSVLDSGPGVTAEMSDHLFEPFLTTRESGLGLGLPIAQSIVEAHGGHLVQRGGEDATEFRFDLPIGPGARPVESAPRASPRRL